MVVCPTKILKPSTRPTQKALMIGLIDEGCVLYLLVEGGYILSTGVVTDDAYFFYSGKDDWQAPFQP